MSLRTGHHIRRFCGHILWLVSLIGCSTAETLLCGTISYQVIFEPSRPIFSNPFVAAAAGTSNDNSGATGSAVGGGTSAILIARYTFRPLNQIVPGDVSLCHYNYSSSHFMRPPPTLEAGDSRMIITTCAECAGCIHDLATAHRLLSRAAVDAGLQSLLVIVRSPASDIEENAPLRAIERIRLVENSPAKFVFMDEEPGPLSVCELMTGSNENDALKNFSKTSVLFVSISFIILMIISLAWLVFYYVQRFRYAHAKDRLHRRLFNAAKKALANTPTRPIKSGDKDLDTDCPVCIDPYKIGDIVRILPCRHTFHKSCVDPWLLEHRTCPMCKSDILKAYGYHISASSSLSVSSAGGWRRAQFSNVGSVPTPEPNVSASGEFHYYPYHNRHNRRSGRPHCASVAATVGSADNRRSRHVRSATIAGDATVSSRYGARTSSFDRGDSISTDSNAFPFTIVNEIHNPFNLITSPRVVKIFDTTNLRHKIEPPALGEIAVNPNVSTFSILTQSDEPIAGGDGRDSTGYGRYATGADGSALNSPNATMPSRQISSAEGRLAMRTASSRLFCASTVSGRPPSQPPTLHVIHTNWRSLNNGQFSIEPSTCSTIESSENNFPESVEIGFEGVDESPHIEELSRRHSTNLT